MHVLLKPCTLVRFSFLFPSTDDTVTKIGSSIFVQVHGHSRELFPPNGEQDFNKWPAGIHPLVNSVLNGTQPVRLIIREASKALDRSIP